MNPEVQSLRVVIYATKHATSPGGLHWSGVAELQAELKSGAIENYVIKSGTQHPTRVAAIEAVRQAFVRDMMYVHPALIAASPPQRTSAWSDCYM